MEIMNVNEINRIPEIAPVPNAPAYLEGVINLRGRIIPVINLRKKLGMSEKENNERSRIIVMDLQGATMGLLVDSVSEVLRIPSGTIEPTPPMSSDVVGEYIKGIAKLDERLIILIDMDMMMEES